MTVKELIKRLKKQKEISNSELAKAINKSLEQAKEIGDLKAEIERLKRKLDLVVENSISARLPHCVLRNNDVAVLTKDFQGYDEFVCDILTEAYKEVAELVNNLTVFWNENDNEHYFKTEDVYNLLKELIERKEG